MKNLIALFALTALTAIAGTEITTCNSDSCTPPIRLPNYLECFTNGNQTKRIYTRLPKILSIADLPQAGETPTIVWNQNLGMTPQKDEVAYAWRGDYFEASIDQETFQHNLWTCDSADRFYTFKTKDLAIDAEASLPAVKKINGTVTFSLRDAESTVKLQCLAFY